MMACSHTFSLATLTTTWKFSPKMPAAIASAHTRLWSSVMNDSPTRITSGGGHLVYPCIAIKHASCQTVSLRSLNATLTFLCKNRISRNAHHFQTPLDEVDAAARILDPILAPLAEGADGAVPLHGKFLKDYVAVEW